MKQPQGIAAPNDIQSIAKGKVQVVKYKHSWRSKTEYSISLTLHSWAWVCSHKWKNSDDDLIGTIFAVVSDKYRETLNLVA